MPAALAGVNLAVENSTWEEGELQEMYLSRKTFAFNADNPGEMNQKREVFENVMKTADVTFQNLNVRGDLPHGRQPLLRLRPQADRRVGDDGKALQLHRGHRHHQCPGALPE